VGWFEAFMHGGIKALLFIFLAFVIGALLLSIFSPRTLRGVLPTFWQQRRVLTYILIATLSGPLIIGLLKQTTSRACPWDLQLYGGQLPYFTLWQEPFFNVASPGRCFPGGHASGGFALLALVPLFQGRSRLIMLIFALSLGMAMGWSRMMQGAHFLSHNLWSAWICAASTWLSVLFFNPNKNSLYHSPTDLQPQTMSR
jgi:membrane-associated PAP2 superfamily phosphatase